MTLKYKLVKNELSEMVVRDNEDGTLTWIPCNLENSDYQEYLKSLDEANPL